MAARPISDWRLRRGRPVRRSGCDSMPTRTRTCRGYFAPDQAQVSLKLGDEQVAFYHATNKSSRSVTGMALYNVTPEKVGKYFHKTACFCFNKQTLSPPTKDGVPSQLLGRSCDPLRSKHRRRQGDHLVLHVLPFLGRCSEVRRPCQGRAPRRADVGGGARRKVESKLTAAGNSPAILNWFEIWRLCGSRVGAVSPAVLLWV